MNVTTSESVTTTWARAKESGAGPRITFPSALYWEPWHGHLNLFSALFHGTTQPKCVHTAFNPKSVREPSCLTIKYVASPFKPCVSE